MPPGQEGGATPGEMVIVEITRWPTADARRRSAASPRCSATSTRPASTPRSSSASTASPTRTRDEAVAEARAARQRGRARRTSAGRTDFRDVADRHHRRRARARLRRCDHDREAAERQLLARRAHRRRVALRAGGQRARREAYERGTSVYFPERAVHMFPSELATGLCSLNPHVDRLVQSCLMEVDRQRRGRPLRDSRRRHQQRRADDLHRRQRDPDRSRSRR